MPFVFWAECRDASRQPPSPGRPCLLHVSLCASAVTSEGYYLPQASVCFGLIMVHYWGTRGTSVETAETWPTWAIPSWHRARYFLLTLRAIFSRKRLRSCQKQHRPSPGYFWRTAPAANDITVLFFCAAPRPPACHAEPGMCLGA